MGDIAQILISVCLFIHLGLGDALCKAIGYDFILFKCQKCCAFWSVLCYTLSNEYPILESFAISFLSAYISLWISLMLSKMAEWYEKWSE